jgi:hypothetical protein
MKISGTTRAKVTRRTREHSWEGFRTSHLPPIFIGILASAFTGLLTDWLSRTFGVRWRFVMRYRSATVADSHGLPLNLERNKERRTRAGSANTPGMRNLFVCAFLVIEYASHDATS